MEKKVVIVTGSSRGLGKAIAQKFADQGAYIVINYVKSEDKAQQLVQDIGEDRAIAIQADVRDSEQINHLVTKTIEHFGQLDVIVSNALINFKFDPHAQQSLDTIDWKNYNEQFEGSVKAALNLVQASLPYLKDSPQARIITIGTNLFQNPVVPYHEYTSGKAALLGFTRNIAKELGPDGITANMISGGLLQATDASSVTTPEVFDLIANSSALQRVTTPEDVAEVVAFIGSEASRGLTGQNITVDSDIPLN